ncbi:MAG: hypothetical protein JXR37_04200 [Kiritimatiellae bacterium]|nr:hypothetical protein [Kiritimatiellia bacterium]
MQAGAEKSLQLGIDIGTSKVAAVLWDGTARRVAASDSLPHGADVANTPPDRAEQDAEKLLAAVRRVLAGLDGAARATIRAIGVTGQMHGVVLSDAGYHPLSPLITWQDTRCLAGGFLDTLRADTGEQRLAAGFGCATLAWLASRNAIPAEAAAALTIQDLLVACLTEPDRPVTDETDAASWGLYDPMARQWCGERVRKAQIPPALLPRVQAAGTCAGAVTERGAGDYGVPAGIPVMAAVGDNQASIWSSTFGHDPERVLALTLGTGAQLSAVLPAGTVPGEPASATFEYRPYPGARLAAVAASLAGGAALSWFADAVAAWCRDLGLVAPEQSDLFARLNRLGLDADTDSGLRVRPHIDGERHDPAVRASITGIGRANFSLGSLYQALADGIIANLRDRLPAACLAGREAVVGSGNAVRRQPLVQAAIERVMGLPLVRTEGREEAALGAAMLAAAL